MPNSGYNIYKVQHTLAMQDPLIPKSTRYHYVLFIETHASGGGQIFHVIGDLVTGMSYSTAPEQKPELSPTYCAKTYLGRISCEDYPARLDQVLRTVPPPHRQRAFNPRILATEQIKADGAFYQAGEKRPPCFKSTEWMEQRALPALYQHQLLRNDLDQAPLEGDSVQA